MEPLSTKKNVWRMSLNDSRRHFAKKHTKSKIHIQHKLSEPKAEYISSNYSTVVRQNKGQSAALIAKGLNILLTHVSGMHANCPEDSWCRWRQTSSSSNQPPTAYSQKKTILRKKLIK